MLELSPLQVALAASMLPLLAASAFFSCAETCLFGMSENERTTIRRRGDLVARSAERLLADPRMLLITVLLGNMTVNTLYFVLGSVLMLQADAGVAGDILFGVGTLLAIVLFGEIAPKLAANAARMRIAAIVAPALLVVHESLRPLRAVLAGGVVEPLSRLTAPAARPPTIGPDELAALVQISQRKGVIDSDEQRLLRQVIRLRQLRVRDVMTPRVQMRSVRATATRAEVVATAREARLTRLPVHGRNLDDLVGLLLVKPYLLDPRGTRTPLRDHLQPLPIVPDLATLEQLLVDFDRSRNELAAVVDEYGGTAGIVAVEDLVEELVGDIVSPEEREVPAPKPVGRERWEVSGDMGVHEWADAFGQALVSPQVSTVGGLVMQRLGRLPAVGDAVELGNVRLEVTEMEGRRVARVSATLIERGGADREDAAR